MLFGHFNVPQRVYEWCLVARVNFLVNTQRLAEKLERVRIIFEMLITQAQIVVGVGHIRMRILVENFRFDVDRLFKVVYGRLKALHVLIAQAYVVQH